MKVIIYTNKDNKKVQRVDTKIPNNITDEELISRIEEYNKTDNILDAHLAEVDGIIAEAFKFLVGNNGYKTTYDLSNLKEWFGELQIKLEDLGGQIEQIGYDVSGIIRETKSIEEDN